MNIRWTGPALREIEAILDCISTDNPTAALELADRIFDLAEDLLSTNPGMGRPGRVSGTRELVAQTTYLLAYRIRGTSIEILTVRHAARMWPKNFR